VITVSGMQQQLADLEKRRKDRKDREALTPAHAAYEGFVEAGCAGEGHCDSRPLTGEDARKAIAGLEAEPGPGTFREPGTIGPEDFQRPYVETGHASRSPTAAPPNVNPLPPEGRGILRPIELPGTPVVVGHPGPMAATLAAHQAKVQLRPRSRRGGPSD
jgi:hypothetical protein